MKTIKKSLLAGIMAMVVMAAGCSSSGLSSAETKAVFSENKPTALKIVNYMCGFSSEKAVEGQESQKQLWVKNMSEKYGVQFSLYVTQNEVASQYQAQMADGKSFDGVWLYSGDMINKLIKDGSILPIDDYLKDNKTWNALPQAMRDNYKIDGKTWALPMGFMVEPSQRIIRKDWLQKLGLKAPANVDELKNVLTAFKNDLSGEGKVIPMIVANPIADLLDIWGAFDIHFINIQSYGQSAVPTSPIVWDAKAGCFMDQMLKPSASQALSYLRELYTQGLVNPFYAAQSADGSIPTGITYDYTTAKQEGLAGSFNDRLDALFDNALAKKKLQDSEGRDFDNNNQMDINLANSFYTALEPLTGGNSKPVQYLQTSPDYGYVLAKDTAQPKETINFLTDLFFSSKQNFWESYFGTYDFWKVGSDNQVTIKYKDPETMQKYVMAGMCNFVMEMYDVSNIKYDMEDQQNSVQISNYNDQSSYQINITNRLLKNGQGYLLSNEQSSPVSDKYKSNTTFFEMLLYDAIANPKMSVEQALEKYRQTCKLNSAQGYLDDVNFNVGKKSNQTY